MGPIKLLPFALLFLATGALYWPALSVLPFGDDLVHLDWARTHGKAVWFQGFHFRLWERLVNALNGQVFEYSGALTIAASILTFLGSGAMVAKLAHALVPTKPEVSLISATVFLLHPANVSSVIQLDTGSQSQSVLLSLCVLYWALVRTKPPSPIVLFALFLCTLLAKETAAGVMAWVPFAIYFKHRWKEGLSQNQALKSAAKVAGLVVGAFTVYLALRLLTGASITGLESGRYSLSLDPLRVLINVAQILGAAFYFGNSAELFSHGMTTWNAVTISVSLAFFATVAIQSWRRLVGGARSERSVDLATLGLLLSCVPPSLFPAALLGSVGELYVAGLTPFVAILTSIVLAPEALQRKDGHSGGGRGFQWPSVVAIVFTISALGAISLVEKLRMRREVSTQTWALIIKVREAMQTCQAPNWNFILEGNPRDTTSGGRPYSEFSWSNGMILQRVRSSYRNPTRQKWLERFTWGHPEAHSAGLENKNDVACIVHSMGSDESDCSIHCRMRGGGQL